MCDEEELISKIEVDRPDFEEKKKKWEAEGWEVVVTAGSFGAGFSRTDGSYPDTPFVGFRKRKKGGC
jgi:hypothetical protein